MDLSYGEQYENLRTEVKDFLRDHANQIPKKWSYWPSPEGRPWQKLLVERGYTLRTVPKEYGGFGAEEDPIAEQIIFEEFSRAGAPTGLGGQGIMMLLPMLLEKGNEEQKRRFVRPTLFGEISWCQGYSEPNAGSDLTSLATRAERDGDHWVVNGQKIWTSSANAADWMFCLVRSEPDAPRASGITFLLIDMKTPGLDVRRLDTMTSNVGDSVSFNEVFFTDVRVPVDQTVGKPGQGWAVANSVLKFERGGLAPAHVSRLRFDQLVKLMKEPDAHGNRPIDNPVWSDRLMSFDGRIAAMEAHDLRMLSCEINGQNAGIGALIFKLQGTELHHELCGFALEVFGEFGLGYSGDKYVLLEDVFQKDYIYNLGLIIGGGTSQIQKNIISERGLGMPREPRGAAK